MQDVFKNRLDEGMARSIFDSERRLAEMACQQYAQLKDYKSRLQWGFKILDADVMAKEASGEIEKQKIVAVNKSSTRAARPRPPPRTSPPSCPAASTSPAASCCRLSPRACLAQ